MDELSILPPPVDPPADVWATAVAGAFDDPRAPGELADLIPATDLPEDPSGLPGDEPSGHDADGSHDAVAQDAVDDHAVDGHVADEAAADADADADDDAPDELSDLSDFAPDPLAPSWPEPSDPGPSDQVPPHDDAGSW